LKGKNRNESVKIDLTFDDNDLAGLLYGDLNRNITALEKAANVSINVRGGQVSIGGADHDVRLVASVLEQLYELVTEGYPVYPPDVAYGLRILQKSPRARLRDIFLDKVYITSSHRVVSPKSINQKTYIERIRDNDIVFGIGPAGTGKTYLAVAMAISALASKQVRYIILTRPAVEAGEKLGFLPGDMAQKVDPYLRPLYDALHDMLGREKVVELIEQGVVEIAPLAFMRGRTLHNAFVILDEAQNTTHQQMKMFLTRLGINSRAVITGDITQVDLPANTNSGLIEAQRILAHIRDIAFCQFTDVDVVRHHLVQQIIKAYAKSESPRNRKYRPRK
jgi:phosphate starvation-inducible PhoH-like protein